MIIGKYVARIVNPSLAEEMLLNYSKSISRIKASILFENEEFEIVINSRNCISASCSEENKYYLINYLSFKIY